MTTRLAAAAALALCAGCSCAQLPSGDDAGAEPSAPDAGPRPRFDAGVVLPAPDAGIPFTGNQAGEACPQSVYGPADAGGSAPDVVFGLCVALHELKGTALLNDLPAPAPIQLKFQAANYQSEILHDPNGFGGFAVKVMRSRYDILKYHPSGVFPAHEGPEEFGLIDMTRDQARDVKVRAHELRGSALFGGLPFTPSTVPADISFYAAGFPSEQRVSVTSQGGAYAAALLEGTFQLNLSSPPTALMGTELQQYPLAATMTLNKGTNLDIDIPTSELDGNITLDGAPIPDRKAGTDFQLDFVPSGGSDPVAVTHHEGGVMGFTSLLPKDKYSVMLRFEAAPDKHLPSMIFNKQIAQQVDLAHNASLNVNLNTFLVEGGILIDGAPPPPNPNGNYTMFWYGWSGATAPASLLYFELPLDTAAFSLKVFPSKYSVYLWVNDVFGPDLAEGWILIERALDVTSNTQLPISIETATFEGKLFIDGQPPLPGQTAGELRFKSREGTYWRTVTTAAQDGSFRVRLPKGKYQVDFAINRQSYPEYATGWSLIFSTLDLTIPQPQTDLRYDTALVEGPLRVGGKVVADTLADAEVGLALRRQRDGAWYAWDFKGGTPDYRMRIPEGDWQLHFQINQAAIPDVAWGEAPMGVTVPVWKALPPPPPGPR